MTNFNDIQAILKAYPDATAIYTDKGAFKADGTQITVVQSEVDKARVTLNAEYAALEYSRKRAIQYPSIQQQLDMQYWDSVNGTTTWKDAIAKVKSDYPKPS